VRLTGGEQIRLRCKGRGCPFKVKRLNVSKAGRRNMTKLVRKARFRKRAVLKVFVTKPQTVGRFARFKFRAAKAPTLTKRCLQPGATQPSKCPPGVG
jgi:hypothetical protein